jgi:hypothetical protein
MRSGRVRMHANAASIVVIKRISQARGFPASVCLDPIWMRMVMNFEGFKRVFLVKWSLWKYATTPVVVFVATLACYEGGWLLLPDYPSALERSGAIATMIALLSALYDYQGVFRRSEDTAIEWAKKATSGLPRTGAQARERLTSKIKGNTAKVDRFATVLQAITLAIATLVWGFGDLVKPCFFHC